MARSGTALTLNRMDIHVDHLTDIVIRGQLERSRVNVDRACRLPLAMLSMAMPDAVTAAELGPCRT